MRVKVKTDGEYEERERSEREPTLTHSLSSFQGETY